MDISTIDAGEVAVTSLRQNYDNLKFLFKGSLLSSYCFPDSFKSEVKDCSMMVFHLNYVSLKNEDRRSNSILPGFVQQRDAYGADR